MARSFRISSSVQVLGIGVGAPTVIAVSLIYLSWNTSKSQVTEEATSRAKAICLIAEGIREKEETEFQANPHSVEQLAALIKAGDRDGAVAAVPIASAWNALRVKATQSGFEFRVPSFEPRNPANTPNEFQAEALRELASGKKEDLVRFNAQANTLHYFRPVRITQSCLTCHGDPAKSLSGDGADVLGYPMENWKVGDMHGAFEIIQKMDESDSRLASGLMLVVLTAGVAIACSAVLAFLVKSSITKDVRKHAADLGRSAGAQVSQSMSSIAAAIEQLGANIRSISTGVQHSSHHAKSVADRVHLTNEKGQRLDQSSREISDIVQLIQSIADQTNLLALNATIEAARAGDSGKGFAVVAGEVKELARETSRATSTICERIQGIQGDCNALLGDLTEVMEGARKIDDSQSMIASAVQQQQSAAEEIGRTIHAVVQSSQELTRQLLQEQSAA